MFLFFNFFANGVLNPYLGLFLFQNGLNGKQVALLLGIMPLTKILAQPAWSILCDRFHIHRPVLSFSLFSLALISSMFLNSKGFSTWMVLITLFSVFEAPYAPLGVSISLDYLQSIQKPDEFGNLRLWGSLGFVIASLLIGNLFFDRLLNKLPVLYAALMVIAALIVWTLPRVSRSRTTLANHRPAAFRLNAAFLLFLAGMVCVGFTFGIGNQYFAVYMNDLQATGFIIGLGIALMALPEIPLMAKAAQLIQIYGIKIAMITGLLAAPLRYLLYAMIKNPLLVLPIQILHGVTVVSTVVVGATYVARLVPPENRALGQGLFYMAFNGIGMSLGLFSAGLIYQAYGISAVWLLSALLGVIGSLIVYLSFSLQPVPASAR